VHDAEAKLEATEKAYHALRDANKTTENDQSLVDEVLKTYGNQATIAPNTAK
jgi:hypothetical protein